MTLTEILTFVRAYFSVNFPEILEGDPRCKYAIKSRVVKVDGDWSHIVIDGSEGTVVGSAFIEKLEEPPWYAVYFPTEQERLKDMPVDLTIWLKDEDNTKRIIIIREKHLKQL